MRLRKRCSSSWVFSPKSKAHLPDPYFSLCARRAVWIAFASFGTSALGMFFTIIPDRPAPKMSMEPKTIPVCSAGQSLVLPP